MSYSRQSIAVIILRDSPSRGLIMKSTAVNFLGLLEYRCIARGCLFVAGWRADVALPVSTLSINKCGKFMVRSWICHPVGRHLSEQGSGMNNFTNRSVFEHCEVDHRGGH